MSDKIYFAYVIGQLSGLLQKHEVREMLDEILGKDSRFAADVAEIVAGFYGRRNEAQ